MFLLFLVMPLPANSELNNYRISLKILASAFFVLALFEIVIIYFEMYVLDFFSPMLLITESLQIILFSFALIMLINPKFVSFKTLSLHLLPPVIFILIFIVISLIFGNPNIYNLEDLLQYSSHPAIILREIFFVFCIIQLFYFTGLFRRSMANYLRQFYSYFADNYHQRLNWVNYCFYIALAIGILVLISSFSQSQIITLGISVISSIFYLVFGLNYIQYPKAFFDIGNALNNNDILYNRENTLLDRKQKWRFQRQKLIDEKLYLRKGLTIEDVARFLNTNRTSLSNSINTEEGINFNLWINTLRIEEAKLILNANPQINIFEVSSMVGFSEHSNFSRQFKLITGTTPNTWRNNIRLN